MTSRMEKLTIQTLNLMVWRRAGAGGRWATRSRRAGAYSMAVVASLAAMLAIGAVTSTLF